MGLSEDVLRFLTIKVDKHEEGPSAMMQKREARRIVAIAASAIVTAATGRSFGDRDRGDRGASWTAPFGEGGGDRGPRRPREGVEGGAE